MLKTTPASLVIIGAFIFGLVILAGLLFISSSPSILWLENVYLPNIMPILMAIMGFLAIGYLIVSVVSSRFIQSLTVKKTDYSHLEY